MKIKNKKAAELNITVIIVIILAVIALVILVAAFTGGMGALWERIVAFLFGTGGLEVKTVAEQCNLNIGDNWYFCCFEHDTRLFDKITCKDLGPKIGWSDFNDEARNVVCTIECQTET